MWSAALGDGHLTGAWSPAAHGPTASITRHSSFADAATLVVGEGAHRRGGARLSPPIRARAHGAAWVRSCSGEGSVRGTRRSQIWTRPAGIPRAWLKPAATLRSRTSAGSACAARGPRMDGSRTSRRTPGLIGQSTRLRLLQAGTRNVNAAVVPAGRGVRACVRLVRQETRRDVRNLGRVYAQYAARSTNDIAPIAVSCV